MNACIFYARKVGRARTPTRVCTDRLVVSGKPACANGMPRGSSCFLLHSYFFYQMYLVRVCRDAAKQDRRLPCGPVNGGLVVTHI